jgi:hypothetical protein
MLMLIPSPTTRLNSYADRVPVHAMTPNPRALSDPLAKRSAKVFPRASKVQLRIDLSIEKEIARY